MSASATQGGHKKWLHKRLIQTHFVFSLTSSVLNFTFIGASCCPCLARNSKFDRTSNILWLPYTYIFTNHGGICRGKVNQPLMCSSISFTWIGVLLRRVENLKYDRLELKEASLAIISPIGGNLVSDIKLVVCSLMSIGAVCRLSWEETTNVTKF